MFIREQPATPTSIYFSVYLPTSIIIVYNYRSIDSV